MGLRTFLDSRVSIIGFVLLVKVNDIYEPDEGKSEEASVKHPTSTILELLLKLFLCLCTFSSAFCMSLLTGGLAFLVFENQGGLFPLIGTRSGLLVVGSFAESFPRCGAGNFGKDFWRGRRQSC